MITCGKCGRENVDDTATHCGFCGEELPQDEGTRQTLFGYAAQDPSTQPPPAQAPAPSPDMDLGKTMLDASPPVFDPPPAPAPAPEPASARSGKTAGFSGGLAAPASLPPVAKTGGGPAVKIGAGASPAPSAPDSEDAAAAETLMADGEVLDPQAAPTPTPAPPPAAPPPAAPPESAPAAGAPAAEEASTEAPAEAAATPAGNQPGRVLIRVLMALGGLALIGMFFAPQGGTADAMIFSWDILRGAGGMAFISQIYLVAGGLVMLAAALIPLPYLLRALVAILLGVTPLILPRIGAVYWSGWVTLGVLVFLIAALLHRRRYRGSILARIMVVLGFLAVVAVNVIPMHGAVPVVAVFKSLGSASGIGLVTALLPLYLLLITLLALLMALRGKKSGGLGGLWALLLLLYLPLGPWLGAIGGIIGGASPLAQLSGLYTGLSMFIFILVASYGISQVLAKTARSSAA